MAILKNCEIYFPKLDPKRPNAKYNKKNPTWEIQIRTTSKEVKKQWEEMGIKVKAVIPDEEGEKPYYRANLRKKSIKSDGEPAEPVAVVNGQLDPIDPNTIGNGSIGNIRIFQYEYKNDDESGIANVLMKIQLTRHVKYVPKQRDDDFEMEETEVIETDDVAGDSSAGAGDDPSGDY